MEITPARHKVQYYETDKMGIVHHSNFVRWMEEARVGLMEQAGYGYDRVEAEGVVMPVLGIACEYVSMVRFGQTAEIAMRIAHFDGTRMTVTYRMTAEGALCATGESRHCFLSQNGRPVSLKKALPALYALFLSLKEE